MSHSVSIPARSCTGRAVTPAVEDDAPSASAPAQLVRFGEFELDKDGFELRSGGTLVPLEPQVLSLLIYLVDHRHQLVSKNELLDELWGHRFVSESALATQIKRLRQALGDDGRQQNVIKTVHGRGYRFVADVSSAVTPAIDQTDNPAQELVRSGNLGYERTPIFGRSNELQRCREAFADYRLVTLLGIGGTGKTRLAKAFGRAVREEYADGVWFIDLVPVRDESSVYTAISAVLGVRIGTGEARAQLARAIDQRDMLIILDNCEHIEDDVAAVLDYLLEHTGGPRFLATSRDPIDLADELRFFVDPLPVHSATGNSPAVSLFVEVAQRHGLTHENLDPAMVEQICERLDGLPLAIELAAAQLKHLTPAELLERLDRRFDLLAGRQRTGDSRQDSLAEVVEATWSLLNEESSVCSANLRCSPASSP